ncbi:MAG: argininosuccinate lyase [Synergistaceae bacterium]|jgi:argininosuccinate lyase|nr:argininosuccinate lyase [Synergistaceae bacterium]
MWKGRFSQDVNEVVRRFTQSLDLDWRTVQADIRGSIAHARALLRARLLTPGEASDIERELVKIAGEAARGEFVPDESLEDVHMNVESLLTSRLGDTGAKLHTGRSRNDQSATSVRLALRDEIIGIGNMLASLLETLLERAARHIDVVVPGYTHLQQAQPISMGQFWMAHFQAFSRDASRLLRAYESSDECPLGCGALAGSTLPIDREFSAGDLGFSGISQNSVDAVASRDHIVDFHHFASLFGVHASRLSEDLIIYFSSEFGWVKLPDAFCTGSSMMPQKKNPDVLEIVRGKCGQLVGAHVDALVMLKGTPSSFDRDFQEDKRALWCSCDAVRAMLEVMPPLLANVEVDAERAGRGFRDGFIFATDAAEHLVERGVPFRKSHEIVGGVVKWCIANNRSLTSLSPQEWRKFAPQAGDELPSLLTPENSVSRRKTPGGTSPEQVRLQIDRGRKRTESLRSTLNNYRDKYPHMPE